MPSLIRIPVELPNRESFLDRLAVVLIYAGIYLKDIALSWGLPTLVPPLVLAAAAVVGTFSVFLHRSDSIRVNTLSFVVLILAAFFWLLSSALSGAANASSYYFAIPCAVVIVNTAPRFFIKLMV